MPCASGQRHQREPQHAAEPSIIGRSRGARGIAPTQRWQPAFPSRAASVIAHRSRLEQPHLIDRRPSPRQQRWRMRLKRGLALCTTSVIGVETLPIRVTEWPQQDRRWRDRTALIEQCINAAIEGNPNIARRKRDATQVPRSMRSEIDATTLLEDSNRVRRGRMSGRSDASTCRLHVWLEQRGRDARGQGIPTGILHADTEEPNQMRHHGVPPRWFPCRNRAARLVKRCVARTFRTAIARARGCPITTTSCFPRVTPV